MFCEGDQGSRQGRQAFDDVFTGAGPTFTCVVCNCWSSEGAKGVLELRGMKTLAVAPTCQNISVRHMRLSLETENKLSRKFGAPCTPKKAAEGGTVLRTK